MPLPKASCEAAAQRHPAQSERKNRIFSATRQAVWFETRSVANSECCPAVRHFCGRGPPPACLSGCYHTFRRPDKGQRTGCREAYLCPADRLRAETMRRTLQTAPRLERSLRPSASCRASRTCQKEKVRAAQGFADFCALLEMLGWWRGNTKQSSNTLNIKDFFILEKITCPQSCPQIFLLPLLGGGVARLLLKSAPLCLPAKATWQGMTTAVPPSPCRAWSHEAAPLKSPLTVFEVFQV